MAMNPETQKFEPVAAGTPREWARFTVGDEMTVNGVLFRIKKITRNRLILKVVKK